MRPDKTIQILKKVKAIHEQNPHLAMTDITNDEIVQALGIGIEAIKTLVEIAHTALRAEEGSRWQS